MKDTYLLAKRIRVNSLQMVSRANASHIASALSISDILACLYGKVMKTFPQDPLHSERDRFILSKGHGCVSVYATLAEMGFINKKDLETYGDDFSWLMNHISHKVDGVEFSTGALGHGLPFAVGKSLSGKIRNKSFKSFVVLSDGEMDEGSNWEALMFAAHQKLDNLVAIIDYNKLQSLDSIENTLGLEPLREKLSSFGCEVLEVDGHNHEEIISSFNASHLNKPKIVEAHTVKGKGVSFMENSVQWHYKSPDEKQLKIAIEEIENA